MIDNLTNVLVDDKNVKAETRREMTISTNSADPEIAVELGIWLSGLESFLSAGHYAFRVHNATKSAVDSSKEFRLTQSALLRCLKLASRLLAAQNRDENANDAVPEMTSTELNELAAGLRDAVQIGQCIVRAEPLGTGEWKAWCNLLSDKFDRLAAFHKLIRHAETQGEQFLPEPLKSFAASESPTSAENAELALILPRFAKVLKWLSVVQKMLEADEPLKPALLIFSRAHEQASDLVYYINSRLTRFPNEEAEMFASLDAASYTASIELRKIYSQELAGLTELRPPPSIYAGIEAAHALMSESLQHTLVGLARLIDPSCEATEMFPGFQVKIDRSIVLRRELWKLVQLTQAAENDPKTDKIESLTASLKDFVNRTLRFLFYKDTETFERFVEEILVTKHEKDLVPILHRFGAYLETLFGQVNMRAVLENHPFEKPQV